MASLTLCSKRTKLNKKEYYEVLLCLKQLLCAYQMKIISDSL